MKRLSRISITLIAAFAIAISFSCTKGSLTQTSTLKVKDFESLGELHNSFMSNIKDNYDINSGLTSKAEIMNDITIFNTEYAKKVVGNESATNLAYFKKYENFLDHNYLKQYCTRQRTKSTTEEIECYFNEGQIGELPSLRSMINYLNETGTLQGNAYIMLNKIVDLLVRSYEGQISNANFERELNKLIYDFDKQEYTNEESDGNIVGPILAISKSSLEWWKENPDASFVEDKLPAVVAADAGGAITGVVIDSIRQGICIGVGSQGGWDWGSTGWAALGGAVDGSLGLSSKVINAISKLF